MSLKCVGGRGDDSSSVGCCLWWQPLAERLPELVDCRRIMAETGLTRAAAEAVMRSLPKSTVPGLRKVFVRRSGRVGVVGAEGLTASVNCLDMSGTLTGMDTRTRDKFKANYQRRIRAQREADAARQELERLLVANRRSCSVVEMAKAASVSRETVYVLLRKAES